MTIDVPLENLETALHELKKSVKEIGHKKTRFKIEKIISAIEESKSKITNPKPRRTFKPFYLALIPFVIIFLAIGIYYFSQHKN